MGFNPEQAQFGKKCGASRSLACEEIFVACCDIHLVQHDNFWHVNTIRLSNSESHVTNQNKAEMSTVVTLNLWQIFVR